MSDSNEPPTINNDFNPLDKDDFGDDLFQSTVESMTHVSLDDSATSGHFASNSSAKKLDPAPEKDKEEQEQDDDDDMFDDLPLDDDTTPAVKQTQSSATKNNNVDNEKLQEKQEQEKQEQEEDDDLFRSAIADQDSLFASLPIKAQQAPATDNFEQTESLDSFSDKEDMFLDVDHSAEQLTRGSLTVMNDEDEINQSNTQSYTNMASNSTVEIDLKDEQLNNEKIEIVVNEPRKMGDGINAYVAFKITTKTSLAAFPRSSHVVYRRFSDFLGLREQLANKYQVRGFIVPFAPDKNVIGMTKIKINKDDSSSEFIERRTAALGRYLNRTARNPRLLDDGDFVNFLTNTDALPKSSNTSSLSGAAVIRLFGKVGESFSKIAFKVNESDQWFENKVHEIDEIDVQLKLISSHTGSLVTNRKSMTIYTSNIGKEIASLGATEEIPSLSKALSQFAELQEHLEVSSEKLSNSDFFCLHELFKDYLTMIESVKAVFNEREKSYRIWKETEANLFKKNEQRAKLEAARKMDKIPSISQEISRLEMKLDQSEREFADITKNIRIEIRRFEIHRAKEFKKIMTQHIESLILHEQEVCSRWEAFQKETELIKN